MVEAIKQTILSAIKLFEFEQNSVWKLSVIFGSFQLVIELRMGKVRKWREAQEYGQKPKSRKDSNARNCKK